MRLCYCSRCKVYLGLAERRDVRLCERCEGDDATVVRVRPDVARLVGIMNAFGELHGWRR